MYSETPEYSIKVVGAFGLVLLSPLAPDLVNQNNARDEARRLFA